MRMHPQSELENYKLQVELLQEKLHRSEDNRQELEEKLEQIMKKRNEHERTLRSRSQQKYQQFLDEQKKRNERNRKLVEMLERIDQQAAALSARSERLKMMKLQYELYFSKLVQSYSMKTLQGIPAVSLLPIQRTSNATNSLTSDQNGPTESFQTLPSSFNNNNTPQFQRVPLPVVVPIPNEQNRFQTSWTFASAPPGVLIALPNNATHPISSNNVENKRIQSNYCFDYSQFPIGYLQAPPASTIPMQYNVAQSYLQQPQQQESSAERNNTKSMFAADDNTKHPRPHFDLRDEGSSSFPFSDVKTNETISNRTQPQSNRMISKERVCGNKPKKYDDLEINEDKPNGQESQNFEETRIPMFNEDLPSPHQSLKVDKLPNINPNNSFHQQQTYSGRKNVHQGNIPNAIDFRTDDDGNGNGDADDNEYIKYIKEMKETHEKNVPIPTSVTPQEHSIDNITTTLQIQKTQKIDETNVRDDEKINDIEDNERNTSSASSAPLDGKCSIESIGDEALTLPKKPSEYKTKRNISNTTPARNIDPNRDTEQITLFNGTKNSKDESTGASNRTTAIIDGDVGENKENTENTRMDLNTNPISYRPLHFDKKEKMSIEKIENAIYGELLTKPESLTSATGLPDNPRGNGGEDKEIERNSQETKGYEFANSGQDLYEQDPVKGMGKGMGVGQEQVAPYASEIEQIEVKHDEVGDNSQESYPYTENVGSMEEQQYDIQNYRYTDPNADASQSGVPQQEYQYSEEGQPSQSENYAPVDYQNYDGSQYQGEYDANAYQYDYSQAQYDDAGQPQYTPEAYSQEYQQDPYTGEYANYEQIAPNEGETSNQTYAAEGDYAAVEQEVPEIPNEVNVPAEPAVFDSEIDYANQIPENVTEPNQDMEANSGPNANTEQENAQKLSQPASILATEKNSDLASKKKKRVNFVDSETDESSIIQKQGGVSSESDFDFSAN